MKLLFVFLVIYLCIDGVIAAPVGKLINNALAVHKKQQVGKENGRDNIAHSKTRKIKVAPVKEGNADKIDISNPITGVQIAENSSNRDDAIAKKQNAFAGSMQMLTSIATMVLTRMIFKLDYKNKQIVLLCRVVFCAYIILSQALFWFLKHQVNSRDDRTILLMPSEHLMQSVMKLLGPELSSRGPMGGILGSLMAVSGSKSGSSDGASPTTTVKQHDLEEIRKLSSSMIFELLAATYMHFVNKNHSPLLMIPMMGLSSKLKAPIVQLHILRMKPVGPLARPFKSPMELMVSQLRGSATTTTNTPTTAATTSSTSTSTSTTPTTEDKGSNAEAETDVATDSNTTTALPRTAKQTQKAQDVGKFGKKKNKKNKNLLKKQKELKHLSPDTSNGKKGDAAVDGTTATGASDNANAACVGVEIDEGVDDLMAAIDKLGE